MGHIFQACIVTKLDYKHKIGTSCLWGGMYPITLRLDIFNFILNFENVCQFSPLYINVWENLTDLHTV